MVGSTPLCSINRPRRTDTRYSNTFDNTDVMEISSVIGNKERRWTFRNWGDIGLYPASREATQTNKASIHYTKTGSQNITCTVKKRGNMPNESVSRYGFKSNMRRLTSADPNTKVIRPGDGWYVRISRLPGLFAVCRQASPTESHTCSLLPQQADAMTSFSRTPKTLEWTTFMRGLSIQFRRTSMFLTLN